MKRISLTAIALAIALAMVSVAASGQNRSRNNNQASGRVGKALVKKLPADIEGVQLSGNRVRLKPGYKFVKQDDGSVAVARIRGGGVGGTGLKGSWSCSCGSSGTGSCSIISSGNALVCKTDTCTSSCSLIISTKEGNLGVIMY